jgi:two-component system cell cycle sensor histidine kinase/response regulator CckA
MPTAARSRRPDLQAGHEPIDLAEPEDLHGKLVLVADDEELMREMLSGLLASAGATVVTAADGQQAIELFMADPDRYALVLLDQVMPRCTGCAAFKAMHALRPQTRIILMSGFVGEHAMGAEELDGLAGFLAKPFTRAQLLRAALASTPV